uniref:Cilia- and flagella-associated protein 45 n=1 Tax=Leptobrachium leishanense TaxID=445787 RepID=A0A8C5LM78_9ANUR
MPESVLGSLSSASTGSNRNKARKYRTKALSSQVDESLFGIKKLPKDDTPIVQRIEGGRRKTVSAPLMGHKPETIRIITSDLIRDLIIPTEDPSGKSLIIGSNEFYRIKSAAQVRTKEEREMEMQTLKQEKEAAIVILNAKCHAIRDAQLLEKTLITKELEEEEERLDQLMEVQRQKAIKMQEEIEEKRKHERIRGKQRIIQQMEENAEFRILDEEQRAVEAQQMLQYLEKLQMEDYKELEKKRQEQLEIQKEIKRINAENEKKKMEKKEQEGLIDLRVLEYTKQKIAREAEYEAEQERLKKEKEMEVARLRALQERARDYKAEQDELRAKRNQEAMERSWRQKEKERALMEAETNSMLQRSRLEQVSQKEHFLAVQAERDRAEFERVLRVQQEQIQKERKELDEKTLELKKHAAELRRQVRENEQKQLMTRIDYFEGAKRLQEEARQRRARLDDLKKKKLEELKMAGLPDKYCSMVVRKADIPVA